MRYVYIVPMAALLLSACNAFTTISQPDSSFYLAPPTIQRWQKQDAIGRTDTEQRWADFQQCGVKNYMDGYLDLNVVYPGMSIKESSERDSKIRNCMKQKNYIYLTSEECVDNYGQGRKARLSGRCN